MLEAEVLEPISETPKRSQQEPSRDWPSIARLPAERRWVIGPTTEAQAHSPPIIACCTRIGMVNLSPLNLAFEPQS